MRGGMTIDIYIPQGILNPPSSLTKLGMVPGQQSDPCSCRCSLSA